MKQAFLYLMSLALAISGSRDCAAALAPIEPVTFVFSDFKTVFEKGEPARQVAGIMQRIFSRRQRYFMDSAILGAPEKMWCLRCGLEDATDVIPVRDVALNKLQKLQNTSFSELTNLLGRPVFVEGAMHHECKCVALWRSCNGREGSGFMAIEAIAGFNAPTNILFLTIRVGHTN